MPAGDETPATVVVPGTGTRLSLRRDVAPLLVSLAAAFHPEART